MKRLLVLVLLLAACGAPAADTAVPPADAPEPAAEGTQPAATSGSDAIPAALDWSVDRIGGGQIDGGDLAGRDVVLWFWAPW